MKKLLIHAALFAATFFVCWWALGSLPWLQWLKIEQFTKKKQEQVGNMVIKTYRNQNNEAKPDSIQIIVSAIKDKLCLANGIDSTTVKLYVFEDAEINAFAVPYKQIIVNTGLVRACDNPEMLAGVIAHEIGHIEHSHISKKLAKEVGLSALVMLAGGNDNFGLVKEILKRLSSTNFDREQEREADAAAIRYLQNAQIDAAPLAVFFTKLANKESNMPEALNWMATHPNPKERSAAILKAAKVTDAKPVIDSAQWAKLIRMLN